MTTNKKSNPSNKKKTTPKDGQAKKKPASSGKKKSTAKPKSAATPKPLDATESFAAASETLTVKWNEITENFNADTKKKKKTLKSFFKFFVFKK